MLTRPLFTLRLTTSPELRLGHVPSGTRTIFPITGGAFEGARLRGAVLPGGGDWALLRADGVLELDLRVTLACDDGALIRMTFVGLREMTAEGGGPARPGGYFRTLPRFETGAERYAFLNRILAVGLGEVGPAGPVHTFEEIL